MKRAEERLTAAVGGLFLALVGLGLAIWLGSGYVPGGLGIITVVAAVNVAHAVREKQRVRGEMRPAAENFAQALAALRQQKAAHGAEQVRR